MLALFNLNNVAGSGVVTEADFLVIREAVRR